MTRLLIILVPRHMEGVQEEQLTIQCIGKFASKVTMNPLSGRSKRRILAKSEGISLGKTKYFWEF